MTRNSHAAATGARTLETMNLAADANERARALGILSMAMAELNDEINKSLAVMNRAVHLPVLGAA